MPPPPNPSKRELTSRDLYRIAAVAGSWYFGAILGAEIFHGAHALPMWPSTVIALIVPGPVQILVSALLVLLLLRRKPFWGLLLIGVVGGAAAIYWTSMSLKVAAGS